ncbi:MAG: hypothetical protein D6784_00065 [Chloroflexi bacterium]|nr:MAG: hypothetical protein D6784_00065 [Chloroflexota bacterium]
MEEETTGGQNRLFVILAVSLIGLLVLGLVGIGGVFVIRQNLEQQAAAARATPTVMIVLPRATPTAAGAAALTTPTAMPTPTNTPVIAKGSGGETAAAGSQQKTPTPKPTRTPTPVPAAEPAGAATVPETGLGGLEAVLIALGLTAVLFVARRLRTAS